MNHLGLFEGIGGFSLAAKWMGWETKVWCEINPFCQKVLRHHFPQAEGLNDITKTDFTKYGNKIDIITGGFPCQPYSTAGKRKGKEDERHLWPEMLRAVREVQPRWVVGENVLGIINWQGGLVFHEVQTDLEAAGYEIWPFVLPAAGINAPHQRYRVWFIAHRKSFRLEGEQSQFDEWKERKQKGLSIWPFIRSNAEIQNVANSQGFGLQRFGSTGGIKGKGKKRNQQFTRLYNIEKWQNFPTQSPICSRDDGVSDKLDGITFSKWRTESIKAFGNAIVPQVALQIFKTIEELEDLTNKKL